MSRVNVSEATGPVLDWMVAESLGLRPKLNMVSHGMTWEGVWLTRGEYEKCPEYSTDWSQGGPIIEREMINHGLDVWRTEGMKECAASYTRGVPSEYVFGPTPLIAAMRCYVASKMGDEVEIPEGLNHG